jgi:hypothetical protein
MKWSADKDAIYNNVPLDIPLCGTRTVSVTSEVDCCCVWLGTASVIVTLEDLSKRRPGGNLVEDMFVFTEGTLIDGMGFGETIDEIFVEEDAL